MDEKKLLQHVLELILLATQGSPEEQKLALSELMLAEAVLILTAQQLLGSVPVSKNGSKLERLTALKMKDVTAFAKGGEVKKECPKCEEIRKLKMESLKEMRCGGKSKKIKKGSTGGGDVLKVSPLVDTTDWLNPYSRINWQKRQSIMYKNPNGFFGAFQMNPTSTLVVNNVPVEYDLELHTLPTQNDSIIYKTPAQTVFSRMFFDGTKTIRPSDKNWRKEADKFNRDAQTEKKNDGGEIVKDLLPASPLGLFKKEISPRWPKNVYGKNTQLTNALLVMGPDGATYVMPEVEIKGSPAYLTTPEFDRRELNLGNGHKVISELLFKSYDSNGMYYGDAPGSYGNRTIYVTPEGNDTIYGDGWKSWYEDPSQNSPYNLLEYPNGWMFMLEGSKNQERAKKNFYTQVKRSKLSSKNDEESAALKRAKQGK